MGLRRLQTVGQGAVILLLFSLSAMSTALRLPLPSWFGSMPSQAQTDSLKRPVQLMEMGQPIVQLRNLPMMPHPHPPRRTAAKPRAEETQGAAKITGPRYTCKSRTASDLLLRAMERIGGSLFLNQERLDHWMAFGKFDEVFASKYVHRNWDEYIELRGGDRQYQRCAVVGNSGHLLLSSYGRVIDSFDAVIRTNQAPTQNYTRHVGRKTTFRLINRAMSRRYQEAMEARFKRLRKAKDSIFAAYDSAIRKGSGRKRRASAREQPLALRGTTAKLARSAALKRLGVTPEILSKISKEKTVMDRIRSIMAGVGDNDVKVNREMFPMETNVTVVLVTEATSTPEEMESFIRSTRQLRPDVKFVIQSGKARKVVEEMLSVWTKRLQACWGVDTSNAGGSRATTGILATMVMLKQCKSVTLYGFGEPVKGQAFAPFHFYDGYMRRTYQSASKDVHNFSSEFRFLLKLRDEGLLEVCNEESSPLCGYSQEQIAQIKLRGENPSPLDDEPNDEFEEDDDVNGNDAGDDVDESDEDDEAHEEQ